MKKQKSSRRLFIDRGVKLGLGFGLLGLSACGSSQKNSTSETESQPTVKLPQNSWFKISLAQWSLHRMLKEGKLDNLGFAKFTKNEFGIDAIEYVSTFFKSATDKAYLTKLNKQAEEHGVKQLLIMVDEDDLANPIASERKKAIINHYKWVEAANILGCHAIRVNAFGEGDKEVVKDAAIAALGALSQYAQPFGINVIVENHGGYSSDGKWLSDIMRQVNLPNCGTLPDFGNFCMEREDGARWSKPCIKEYDRYLGVEELMPFAKGLSAKSHDFDEDGNEINTNFKKMLSIAHAAGYNGYIGIEYEGENLDEVSGIKKTMELLERYNV